MASPGLRDGHCPFTLPVTAPAWAGNARSSGDRTVTGHQFAGIGSRLRPHPSAVTSLNPHADERNLDVGRVGKSEENIMNPSLPGCLQFVIAVFIGITVLGIIGSIWGAFQ